MTAFQAAIANNGAQPGQVNLGLDELHAKADAQAAERARFAAPADFRLDDHGSVAILIPNNDAAEDWIAENIGSEAPHWGSSGVVIERRYVADIVAGIQDAGFKIAA